MSNFEGLNLAQPILRAIRESGYTEMTPIQTQAIPPLLAGRDILGIAQTGTGKTAAFALPMLHRLSRTDGKALSRRPIGLILAPTRELAGQIADNLWVYGRHLRLRSLTVFGGVSIRNQIRQLDQGTHILVATPGRLLDLMNQRCVFLDAIETIVLDEADRMLDMGFVRDVQKIMAKLPRDSQTALFSATMSPAIKTLAGDLLNDPAVAEVTPVATTAEKIDQQVMFVPKDKKRDLLSDVLDDAAIHRALVFTRTKHGADRVARHLQQDGISCDAIHGNKSQNQRERALNAFRKGTTRVLVATDIAARGIDVNGVTHVINFELPNEPESYVHRIGRTARAGASGQAISFCDHEERAYLRDIERTIRQTVPVNADHAYHVDAPVTELAKRPKRNGGKPGRRRRSGGNRGWNDRRAA
ncbi:MAG: DEAD/DEAH box helicase [Rhodospirillaceae bacterium]